MSAGLTRRSADRDYRIVGGPGGRRSQEGLHKGDSRMPRRIETERMDSDHRLHAALTLAVVLLATFCACGWIVMGAPLAAF